MVRGDEAMRSRILVGGLCTVLLLIAVSTCRQRASNSQSSTNPTEQSSESSPAVASGETTEPSANLTEATVTRSPSVTTADTSEQSLEGRVARLTAEDADAVINVRSLPSPASEPIGLGYVGDEVVLGRAETAEDGYVWHFVTFPETSTVGWIRNDLLDIQPAEPAIETETVRQSATQSDVLKRALDEQCGKAQAIEAYFVTQSYMIYVCKVRNKRLYLSQESGTQQVITATDVEALGGGYIIGNGNFEYRLDSGNFVVVRFDDSGKQEEVLRESVVFTERY